MAFDLTSDKLFRDRFNTMKLKPSRCSWNFSIESEDGDVLRFEALGRGCTKSYNVYLNEDTRPAMAVISRSCCNVMSKTVECPIGTAVATVQRNKSHVRITSLVQGGMFLSRNNSCCGTNVIHDCTGRHFATLTGADYCCLNPMAAEFEENATDFDKIAVAALFSTMVENSCRTPLVWIILAIVIGVNVLLHGIIWGSIAAGGSLQKKN